MSTIFDSLFTETRQQQRLYPSLAADAIRVTLVGIEPYREWVRTGRTKPNGDPQWEQKPGFITDESGERLRCTLSFVLTDENGLSTSASAPFRDQLHYFDEETVKALMANVGKPVKLTNPRVEFRELGKPKDKDPRYGVIETKLVFAFDGVEV